MRKVLFYSVVFFMAVLFYPTFAQLSGNYSIGSGGDYSTINSALNDLVNVGISGPVVFNIISGTYTEQISIPEITGVSPTNTITFQSLSGNASDVVIQFQPTSSDNYIVNINGTDYLRLKNLTLQSITDPTYRRVIFLEGSDEDIQITGCQLNGAAGYGDNFAIIYSTTTSILTDLQISNNIFDTGGYGILLYASSVSNSTGTIISSNIFNSIDIGSALEVHEQNGIEITGNEINNITGSGAFGINISSCSGAIRILKNKIQTTTTYGLVLSSCDGTTGNEGLIANNFIYGTSNSGIYLYASSFQNIYHNSISINSGNSNYAALYFYLSNSSINVENNILSNEGSGLAISVSQSSAINTLDYNDYYSLGDYIASWENTGLQTVQDLQNVDGQDNNSVSCYPALPSNINLNPSSPLIDDEGFDLTSVVNDDINGTSRTVPVSMGAVEYNVSGNPLSGSYDIGGGNNDYSSLTAATADMKLEGINSVVTFNIYPGTYNEQINLEPYWGSSAANTITFQSQTGNPSDVIIQYQPTSSDNYVIKINGTDNLIIKNLTLQSVTDPDYRRVLLLNGNNVDLQITGCQLNGAVGYGNNFAIIYSTTTSILTDLQISNNTFNTGSYGVELYAYSIANSTGTIISSNVFNSIDIGAALEIHGQNGIVINENEINNISSGAYGINISSCDGAIRVLKNKIQTTTASGLVISSCDGTSGNEGLIANNFVSGTSNSGIYLYASSFQNIYHNSASINSTNSNYAALYLYLSNSSINVVNNLLNNEGTGLAISVSQALAINTLNYNDYYSLGDNIASWENTNIQTLEDLQTADNQDTSSVSKEITFVSTNDLHLSGSSIGDYDLSGIQLSSVSDDIDYEPRGTTPYMGADENLGSPLPVELISFTVNVKRKNVLLNWSTATEVNNYGFEIERKTSANWEKIGFVNGSGNSTTTKKYSYIDVHPSGGNKYKYRLKQIDNDGSFKYSKEFEVKLTPIDFNLSQNYPNPFNPTTKINFRVPEETIVNITIYDITGRQVKKLLNKKEQPGYYSITLNGSEFSSGVYFYRMITGSGYSSVKKLMLLK